VKKEAKKRWGKAKDLEELADEGLEEILTFQCACSPLGTPVIEKRSVVTKQICFKNNKTISIIL